MKLRYKIINGFLIFLGVVVLSLAITIGYTSDCEPVANVSPDAATMKAVIRRCYGGPDAVEYADIERPRPCPKEIVVSVKAAAVNPLDYHFVRGSP